MKCIICAILALIVLTTVDLVEARNVFDFDQSRIGSRIAKEQSAPMACCPQPTPETRYYMPIEANREKLQRFRQNRIEHNQHLLWIEQRRQRHRR